MINDASADESLDFFVPPKKIYYRHGGIDLHADVEEAKVSGERYVIKRKMESSTISRTVNPDIAISRNRS